MKLRELIDQLSKYDPDADVRVLCRPHPESESTLIGIVSESELRAAERRGLGSDAEVVYLLQGRPAGHPDAATWMVDP